MVREGIIEDLPRVLELVKELAEYENGLHEVTNTVEMMEKEGFGEQPVFGFFVAEKDKEIVGISIYYFRYSTWKGKKLYLEDIVVTEKERGNGIGKALFDRTVHKAIEEECNGMSWQVLDWNEPAINFYREKYQSSFDNEWINCALNKEQLQKIKAES